MLTLLFFALAMSAPEAARSVPLAATEPPDFYDSYLSYISSPQFLGALDIGVNTISGAVPTRTFQGFPFGDTDWVQVTLAPGLSIASITIAISGYTSGTQGTGLVSAVQFVHPFATGGVRSLTTFTGDGTYVAPGFSPLEQELDISIEPANVCGQGGCWYGNDTFSYVISILVVPEPGLTHLLGASFAVSILARRLRRAQAERRLRVGSERVDVHAR